MRKEKKKQEIKVKKGEAQGKKWGEKKKMRKEGKSFEERKNKEIKTK